jgi:hypothetical protein
MQIPKYVFVLKMWQGDSWREEDEIVTLFSERFYTLEAAKKAKAYFGRGEIIKDAPEEVPPYRSVNCST